jgi:hypothetical protein
MRFKRVLKGIQGEKKKKAGKDTGLRENSLKRLF